MATWATTIPAAEVDATIDGLTAQGYTVLDHAEHEPGWITLLVEGANE